MKRIVLLCLLIMTCIVLSSCADNLISKKQIFTLVEQNYKFLQQCIDESDPDRALTVKGIKDNRVNEEEEYVRFDCGATGIVPASSYYGFYYSPADIPLAVDVTVTDNLTPQNNGWGWKEPDGDNIYYTERIMDCWYYYESHF